MNTAMNPVMNPSSTAGWRPVPRPPVGPTGRPDVLAGDDGVITVLVLLLTPMLLALAGLVWDGGLAITARQHAADLSEQAARAGADRLDLDAARGHGNDLIDTAQARAAACHYLAVAAPRATCTATATPTSVTVQVSTTSPTALLSLIGVQTLTVHGHATAGPAEGVLTDTGGLATPEGARR